MNTPAPAPRAPEPTSTDLGGRWTCRALAGPVPAELADRLRAGIPGTVPGVVHLDLLAAGLIPDPYVGENEARLTWVGRTDWEYSRSFEHVPDGHDRHELVAAGLDTVATIWLNDAEVGRTQNHHRGYRFDVAHLLRPGTNHVRVVITSALEEAERREAELGARPHSNPHPFNALRKPAYAFGWDWGPELVTAGIWRTIRLEGRSTARLSAVRPLTSYGADGARLDLRAEIDQPAPGHTITVEVRGTGEAGDATSAVLVSATTGAGVGETQVELAVPGAAPWWPRSHGGQPLYPVTVTLAGPDGAVVDVWTGRVGFRTVTIDTSPDDVGNGFVIRVNGTDVYVRGANWIPDDTYLPRVDRASLATSLADAVEANMNLLRVWGGGIYESDDFYGLCDELGLLVWQDFTLACAAYSEDASLAEELEAEAREAVTRLCAHPSLALLNGGNENIWGWADWGWRAALRGATWGEGYYTRLLPDVVAELAPGVPYCEGSPYSFDRYLHPNDDVNGTMHIWDVWNRRDYTAYRDYRPRFVSEFGFQGPPAFSTLESVVRDEPRSPHGPQMLVHQKAEDGNGKLERGLGDHLPLPADYVDWHWATQLNQARAVRYGIEHFRSLAPYNTGAVMWQLNDCWPVVSWAAVDSHRIRKPLWFALREVFADRLVTVQPRDGSPAVVLHNETDEPWRAAVTVRRLRLDGATLAVAEMPAEVGPRGSATLPLPPALTVAADPTAEVLVADAATGERGLWYFAEDTCLALSADAAEVSAEPAEGGYVVQVRARALVKDLTLLVDHADPGATVDRALVTLLPGESAELRVRSSARLDPAALTMRPVLRTANDLVAAPSATEVAPEVVAAASVRETAEVSVGGGL
ncbi:glycoside hydrolase family 2 protein [Georgenia muralis]